MIFAAGDAGDPDLWVRAEPFCSGAFGVDEVRMEGRTLGEANGVEADHLIILFLRSVDEFLPHTQGVFKRKFLSVASCARCGGKATEINLRPLRVYDDEAECRVYIVCDCGCRVWQISKADFWKADRAIMRAEYSRRNNQQRKQILMLTGGSHTRQEISDILFFQGGRCIYCDALFTADRPPTRDHVRPVTSMGTDWAFNIVLACRSCNSHRGMKGFLAFCNSLSETQKRKIILYLDQRLNVIDLASIPPDVKSEFSRLKGIRTRLINDQKRAKKTSGRKRASKPRLADILGAAARRT